MYHPERDPTRILDVLYEGMIDDAAWLRALCMLGDLVSGSAVALFSCNPSSDEVFRADLARTDPQVMQAYQNDWIHRDPRHAASLTCPVGIPQVDGMVMNVRDFHRTMAFNEFFRPSNIPFHIATWIERRPQRGVVLSIQGSLARGAFTEEESRRLTPLIPHLRRVIGMKDRLVRAKVHANGLVGMMDRLPFGVMLLAADLEILEASATARALLAAKAGLHDEGGRLTFLHSADKRAFSNRLREDPLRARLDETVSIARPHRQPLSLLVLPLAPAQEMWMAPAARWLVMIFDPDTMLPHAELGLQRTLGLSPAEAALAQRIASGLTLTQAATELGVSLNTVRTQLKSIFSKVGVRTQAQLVGKILGARRLL